MAGKQASQNFEINESTVKLGIMNFFVKVKLFTIDRLFTI